MATTTQQPAFEVMPPETKEPSSLPRTIQPQPETGAALVLMPVMNLEVAKQRLAEFQQFVKGYMVLNEDYGMIPGVKKPSLFKPGAEKLCELYGLADTYPEDRVRRIEDWDSGLFFYEFTCVLTKKGTNIVVGEGKGSCNSYESRYRFRNGERLCPECGKPAIIKGKAEYGGGWLCWAKKDGCGAKFTDGDSAIERQEVGKVENENLPDVMNTVLKIAKKRAKIDAVIGATRSSGIFTQDVEEMGPAAASPEESSKPRTVPISGKVVAAKIVQSELWLTVAEKDLDGALQEYACKVPTARKDLRHDLEASRGSLVQLLTELRFAKDKRQFYEVKGILGISAVASDEPSHEITDEDIPF